MGRSRVRLHRGVCLPLHVSSAGEEFKHSPTTLVSHSAACRLCLDHPAASAATHAPQDAPPANTRLASLSALLTGLELCFVFVYKLFALSTSSAQTAFNINRSTLMHTAAAAPSRCVLVQLRLRIDDPLDSSAVHLVNGVLGMLLLSFVARPSHVELLTGSPCAGIFYTRTGWLLLGMQVLGELWGMLVSCWTQYQHGQLLVTTEWSAAGCDLAARHHSSKASSGPASPSARPHAFPALFWKFPALCSATFPTCMHGSK